MGIALCIIGIILIGIGCFYISKSDFKVVSPKEEIVMPLKEEEKQPEGKSKPKKTETTAAEKKGAEGEMRVNQLLSKLPAREFQTLNDLLLSSGINYTQIDHVVVSIYGIFCIETKSWSGRIIGTTNSEQWTQYVGSNTKYYKNAISQNKIHINVLQGFLSKSGKAPLYSVVVFPSDTDLMISNCNNNEQVITRDELLMVLLENKKPVMTEEQMIQTIKILSEANIIDPEIRKQHVLTVKVKAEKDKFGNTETCPKCGAPLVMKSGPKGIFWGCSAFPECKYSKNF